MLPVQSLHRGTITAVPFPQLVRTILSKHFTLEGAGHPWEAAVRVHSCDSCTVKEHALLFWWKWDKINQVCSENIFKALFEPLHTVVGLRMEKASPEVSAPLCTMNAAKSAEMNSALACCADFYHHFHISTNAVSQGQAPIVLFSRCLGPPCKASSPRRPTREAGIDTMKWQQFFQDNGRPTLLDKKYAGWTQGDSSPDRCV